MAEELQNFDVLRLTTGSEQEQIIREQRDAFFRQVLLDLGFNEAAIQKVPTEITTMHLGLEEPSGFYPIDDKVHCLVLDNEALALVYDRRDDGNYHEVTFWSRPPSSLAAEHIGNMVATQDRHIEQP